MITAPLRTKDDTEDSANYSKNLNHKPDNNCYVASKSHVATLLGTSVVARPVIILSLHMYSMCK